MVLARGYAMALARGYAIGPSTCSSNYHIKTILFLEGIRIY